MIDPLIVLFGLGVGIMVGLTGMGGGSLMTPALILVFGTSPLVAVGTDLAYAAVTKTVGGAKHFRQRTVETSLALWMALGSVPAALVGVYALELAERAAGESFERLLLTALAGALLFTGLAVLARALLLRRLVASERQGFPLARRHKVAAVIIGVFVGFVLGVTSAGSGALVAVALILLFRLVPASVVGTDVFHAALLLWAAALAHLVAGNIDFALAGTILIGSIPGVWLGSHFSVRLPVAVLRTLLGVVLVGSGLMLLLKSGAEVAPVALIVLPLAVGVYFAARAVAARAQPTGSMAPIAPAPEQP